MLAEPSGASPFAVDTATKWFIKPITGADSDCNTSLHCAFNKRVHVLPLQAAPNLTYFSKAASAGARLFVVINRKPDIDTGGWPTVTLRCCPASCEVSSLFEPVCLPLCCLPTEDPAGEAPSECVGELRLERVTFRYPARPDVMVMRDFSLEVKAGEPVGVPVCHHDGCRALVCTLCASGIQLHCIASDWHRILSHHGHARLQPVLQT